MQKLRSLIIFVFIAGVSILCVKGSYAQNAAYYNQKIAEEFLNRVQSGFEEADEFMKESGIIEKPLDLRGLPEGELLIFDIIIPPRLEVEGVVFGEISGDTILISLRDFISVLQFPIEYDSSAQIFDGWFLTENNRFRFQINDGVISTHGNEYRLSDNAMITDDDILVPLGDMKEWFEMDIDVDISTQRLVLDPITPFPATKSYERRQKKYSRNRKEPPSLPRYDKEDYGWFEVPAVDVTTRSRYRDTDIQGSELDNFANIRTAGEFLKGALTTNTAINDDDGIFSARVTYLQESADPELLGSLKARRFELGDLTPTRLPITGNAGPETGVRITNADPLVNLTLPSTRIEGYYFPNWDIELYRDNSLLSFQETDEEGYYAFENVPLFSDRNFFRIVAYGPQGEIREEVINIPYDRDRLAESGGVYDISLTFQDRQFYERDEPDSIDRNEPHLVGFYEIPIMERSALRVGGRYRQEEGEDKVYASAALSTSFKEALINAEVATDEQGEARTELSATRQFGAHRARMDLDVSTDEFDPGNNATKVNVFSNRYNFEGPLGVGIGISPRYSANFRYDVDSDNNTSKGGNVTFNTQFQRFGLNQSFGYSDNDLDVDGANYGGTTALTGFYGKNLFRGIAQYDFKPETELELLSAFWKYRFNSELDSQLQIDRDFGENKETRYSGQLNWRLDEAIITPRVSYDTNGDFETTLNTRFSIAKEPLTNDLILTRDTLTNFGTLSALVYLDKDGNYQYDGDDEPIDNARIMAPQNAGGGFTDKDGIAYLTRFRPSLITDIYLDNASLSDPFWISAKKGHSIMPRTGNNIYMEFPVHISGEIDGTVYKRSRNGESKVASNISVALFNMYGELEQKTVTGPDGFYLFSLVPPGKYYLGINSKSLDSGYGRPVPKLVEIGYDGTIIYAQDLFISEGVPDIPFSIKKAEGNALYKQQVSLNLGDYESPLMSAYTWRKLANNFSYYLGGAEKIENNIDNTLRVALPENSLSSGFQRCHGLVKGGEYCEVEIYLAGTK